MDKSSEPMSSTIRAGRDIASETAVFWCLVSSYLDVGVDVARGEAVVGNISTLVHQSELPDDDTSPHGGSPCKTDMLAVPPAY